ncbi:hypothetical protein [Antribacter gilvus]|uniref:hypothetical protein n=1 Tax=Antribacter gilvus TaxID=2304675 RepID=UPI00198092AB|nr:hypothetical protein [Antribacter gilvus]
MSSDDVIDGGPGWHIDPATLLPVLDNEDTFRAANPSDPALDVLVALWSGNPDRAARLLEPLVVADPSWRLQALAADVTRDRGDTATAVKILESLHHQHRHTTRGAVLVQHLGKAHFVAGDHARAAAYFRRALDLRTTAGADDALVTSSRRALDRALDLVAPSFAHVRDWGWGVAFRQDSVEGEIPDVDTSDAVTVTPLGLGIGVRHGQDCDWQAGEEGPALVTIRLDRPGAFTPPERAVVVDVVLETPSLSLSLGDAEDEILLPVSGARTRVVISHVDNTWHQPTEVWIDLHPVG